MNEQQSAELIADLATGKTYLGEATATANQPSGSYPPLSEQFKATIPFQAAQVLGEFEQVAQIDYADMVLKLAKPGADILASLTPEKCHLWHMATGINGEAGELTDAIKKFVIYNKGEINRMNVIEELGDLEFYLEGVRQGLGITRQETLAYNVNKLGDRYKKFVYTDQAAQDRADKQITGETDKVEPGTVYPLPPLDPSVTSIDAAALMPPAKAWVSSSVEGQGTPVEFDGSKLPPVTGTIDLTGNKNQLG